MHLKPDRASGSFQTQEQIKTAWDDFKIDSAQFTEQNRKAVLITGHMLGLEIFKEKRAGISNLYFDTSGSERVRPSDILDAIRFFGDDHAIFGTDTPYAGIDEQIQKINALPIPDRVKEQIFIANIRNVLPVGNLAKAAAM